MCFMTKDMTEAVLKHVISIEERGVKYNFNGKEKFSSVKELSSLEDDILLMYQEMATKVIEMADVQKVENYQGYKMVTYGDDLDPSYLIVDPTGSIVDSGTNGFSDGYIFKLEDWVLGQPM